MNIANGLLIKITIWEKYRKVIISEIRRSWRKIHDENLYIEFIELKWVQHKIYGINEHFNIEVIAKTISFKKKIF